MTRNLSNLEFARLIDCLPTLVWMAEAGGERQYFNQRWLDFTGAREAELLDGQWLALVHPEDRAQVAAAFDRQASGATSVTIEYRLRRQDGVYRSMIDRAQLCQDEHGEVQGWAGAAEDQTESKETAAALAASEHRFRTVLEDQTEVVSRFRPDGSFTFVNDVYCRFFGRTQSDLETTDWRPRAVAEDVPLVEAKLQEISPTQPVVVVENRVFDAEGRIRWMEFVNRGCFDAAGRLVEIQSVGRDITQRKETEARLRAGEEQYRFLMQNIPPIVFVFADEMQLIQISDKWFDVTGQPRDADIGKIWPEAIHPDDRAATLRGWQDAVARGVPFEREYRLLRVSDHSYRWYFAQVLPMRDAEGKITRWFGCTTDIHDRKAAAQALEQAKTAAELANRAKDEFLAHISHELRTPLNGILGMVDLTLDDPLSSPQRERVRLVRDSAQGLLVLVNDLLDLAKIEAGKLELHLETFEICSVLASSLRTFASRAREKDIDLATFVAADVPAQVIGDPHRLRQILLNLIGNAVKFTQTGAVVVRVELESRHDDTATLLISVRDTGIGIRSDRLPSIFRPFEQAETSTARRFGGTGLGLAIVKRLVELMQGSIEVDSTLDRGSTFRVRIELGMADGAAALPLPRVSLPARAWIATAHATVGKTIVEQCAAYGVAAQHVTSIAILREELRHLRPEDAPAAMVILDEDLCEGWGAPTAQRLRLETKFAGGLALLHNDAALPSHLGWRESGITVCLSKPCMPDELRDAIAVMLEPETSSLVIRSSSEPRLRPGAASKLAILVAEDNPVNQQIVAQLFERDGHHVVLAGTGAEALARFDAGAYDLILMDIHLPDMDGMEATRLIRAREAELGRRTTIAAMTASAMPADRDACLAAGMDAFLTKPLRFPELRAMAAELAQKREQQSPPSIADLSRLRLDLGPIIGDLAAILRADAAALLAKLDEPADIYRAPAAVRQRQRFRCALAELGALRALDAFERLDRRLQSDQGSHLPTIRGQFERLFDELIEVLEKLSLSARKGGKR